MTTVSGPTPSDDFGIVTPSSPDPLTADNATERERLAYGRGWNKKAIDGSHVTGGDASLMAGGVSRSTAVDAGAQTPPPAALPSAPDHRPGLLDPMALEVRGIRVHEYDGELWVSLADYNDEATR